MKLLKKGTLKEHFIDIICISFILLICLWNVGSLNQVRGEMEFAYWGIAADLLGWDWREVLAASEYYSFGYSFVLFPLVLAAKLGVSMAVVYKAGIALNALFLSGVYIIVRWVEGEICSQFPKLLRCAAALMIATQMGNTAQMNITSPEVYLRFIFWCIIATLIRFLKKPSYKNSFLLLTLSIYISTVHMRAIGITASVAFVLLVYILTHFKELRPKYILFLFSTIIVWILIFWGMKLYVTNTIYSGSYAPDSVNAVKNISTDSVNDLGANINHVKGLFNLAGIKDVFLSVCGKLYYAFGASFLLGGVGFVVALVQFFSYILKKLRKQSVPEWQCMQWYSFFVLLAFMGEILVSAIFKCLPIYREGLLYHHVTETIVFGRYADFVVGGITLLGIYGIYYIKQYYKEILAAIMCYILLAMVVQFQFDILVGNVGSSDIAYFRISVTPWFAILADKNISYFSYYVAVVSTGLFLLVTAAGLAKERKINALAFVLTVISVVCGMMEVFYTDEYNISKKSQEKHTIPVVDIIDVTDKDMPIYWINKDYTISDSDMYIIQWMIGRRSIKVRTLNDLETIDINQALLICYADQEDINNRLEREAELIYESGEVNVYIEEENAYYKAVKEKVCEANYKKLRNRADYSD